MTGESLLMYLRTELLHQRQSALQEGLFSMELFTFLQLHYI